jgi:hypothetical protein
MVHTTQTLLTTLLTSSQQEVDAVEHLQESRWSHGSAATEVVVTMEIAMEIAMGGVQWRTQWRLTIMSQDERQQEKEKEKEEKHQQRLCYQRNRRGPTLQQDVRSCWLPRVMMLMRWGVVLQMVSW